MRYDGSRNYSIGFDDARFIDLSSDLACSTERRAPKLKEPSCCSLGASILNGARFVVPRRALGSALCRATELIPQIDEL